MKKLFKDKKGNFPDVGTYLETGFIIAFVLLMSFTILIKFNEQVVTNSNIPVEAQNASTNFNSVWFKSDFITPFILLGFLSFSIVAARLIPSSSKFILIPILAMLFFPLASMFVGNWWDSINSLSAFSSAISHLFFTNFIFSNIVVISLLYSFLIGLALYTKNEVAN